MIEKRVIVAGHICLDITPDLSTVPLEAFQCLTQPGKMIQSGKFLLDSCGAVSNTGLSLHRLGAPTTLIGKIGDDLFGQKLQQILQVDDPTLGEDLVVDPSTPTSVSLILNPPDFKHSALHFHGANDGFYASDLPRALLEKADVFHFGYPPLMRSVYRGDGAELISILRRARRAGLTTSLAFASPEPSSPAGHLDWVEVLANVLPHTDLFLPSIEDLLFLLKPDHARVLCQSTPNSFADRVSPSLIRELALVVLDHGVKAVMINLGARGIYLRTGKPGTWSKGGRGLLAITEEWHDREMWAPAFDIELTHKTTAEDAAAAGFLASILFGARPETAIIMAAAAAACASESLQGIRALPKWDALLARVQNGWHAHPLDLPDEEWRKDETHALWHKK